MERVQFDARKRNSTTHFPGAPTRWRTPGLPPTLRRMGRAGGSCKLARRSSSIGCLGLRVAEQPKNFAPTRCGWVSRQPASTSTLSNRHLTDFWSYELALDLYNGRHCCLSSCKLSAEPQVQGGCLTLRNKSGNVTVEITLCPCLKRWARLNQQHPPGHHPLDARYY
jgi:hypothetical protein